MQKDTLVNRFVSPLPKVQKNSTFLKKYKTAGVSAESQSIVSICKFQGYSVLKYQKKFFAEITAGNRD